MKCFTVIFTQTFKIVDHLNEIFEVRDFNFSININGILFVRV